MVACVISQFLLKDYSDLKSPTAFHYGSDVSKQLRLNNFYLFINTNNQDFYC